MTVSDCRRLFKYEFWANRTVAEALSDARPEAVKLFSHILASQRLWLDRINDAPMSMPVWPRFSADACRRHLPEIESDWKEYLNELSDVELRRNFSYVNSKGQSWTSNVADTLLHLITHSCYHRGQIALRLRLADVDPPYTDFVHVTRNNLL